MSSKTLLHHNVDYISGPMSLSYHVSSNYKQKIYIFGEQNGLEGQCSDQKELDKNKTNYVNVNTFFVSTLR